MINMMNNIVTPIPLSTIQKKIKNMLGSTAITMKDDKPETSNKRVNILSVLGSDKSKKSGLHRKTPSAKADTLASKNIRLADILFTDNQVDVSNKDHHTKSVARKLDARHAIEKTLGRDNIVDSTRFKQQELADSKESIKNVSLYQKFSKRLAESKLVLQD